MPSDTALRAVIDRIDAAWRLKRFDDFEACFHPDAVIVGPGHVEFARGRGRCAASYVEFATDAKVHDYAESAHVLRMWQDVAIHTFDWQMRYRRDAGERRERGSDQQVFERTGDGWQLVFRRIDFAPAP